MKVLQTLPWHDILKFAKKRNIACNGRLEYPNVCILICVCAFITIHAFKVNII
jgi:hypothetical protein